MTLTDDFITMLKHINPQTLAEAMIVADIVAKDYFRESEVRSLFNNINTYKEI